MTFKNYFSVQAGDYAKFRPTYPPELIEYVASIAPGHQVAWDCATGNGQAAISLASHFDRVIATDASEKQINRAQTHARVAFRVAPAESSGVESGSVDLITVAQALHWFDLPAFYAETKRVLKPGGVLAVWNYNLLQSKPEIDAVVNRFYNEIVGPFWPPERQLIERGYEQLPFPFEELDPPRFKMTARWSLDSLLGYLGTWSATQRYIQANQQDPIILIASDLQKAWGTSENQHLVTWPLQLRLGRGVS
jgi:SAM-dependent methyltransferase